MLADLHIHTKASDGLHSPEEICAMAIKAGLAGIAITDHDTLDGFLALKKRNEPGLEVLPGVEISTHWHGEEVHLLGYNVSPEKGYLQEMLVSFQEERRHRITKIVNKIQKLGFQIDEEEIIACAKGKSLGRPHVAQALIAKGYYEDVKEVFEELLEAGAPAYVPREKITPEEGIKAIASAGGIPVLAHPGLVKNCLELIAELTPIGLKGVEVYYPLHSQDLIHTLLIMTQEKGLLVTGGSDFHGFTGDKLGKSCVDFSVVEAIKDLSR
ncbi:MAG TPA: PHP domain-containing protein [Clostridia bacterium]|jgi:predicted metal-dependent phosphoesterase TrpH|nr:PHP domain-containing protein [Clostridia bacterium]